MRIALISDTQGATSPDVNGHGLGRANFNIAEGLYRNGHEVYLLAAPGSSFSGTTFISDDIGVKYEAQLAKAAYGLRSKVDVYIDASHNHILPNLFPDLNCLTLFHDKWQPHRRNAVLMSEGQRALMDDKAFHSARVVHHQLDAIAFTPSYRPDDNPAYAAFIGFVYKWKQPILAIEAAARAQIRLYLVGSLQEGLDPLDSEACNSSWLGAQHPAQIQELLRGASVYLQLGDHEAFGLTTVEAGLSGTPVVAWPTGGNLDTICEGVNGYFVDTTREDKVGAVVEAMEKARTLKRKCVREFTAEHFGKPCLQIMQIEALLEDVVEGQSW